MKKLFLLIMLFFNGAVSSAQENVSTAGLFNKMAEQLTVYPMEKIHLHIDRSIYIPGDTVWFRAYLVHSAFHTPQHRSRYIYAELLNPQDSLLRRVKIRVDSLGVLKGYIAIPDGVPEGRYALRTYSRYMLSQGETYLSKRAINIRTPVWGKIRMDTTAQNRSMLLDLTDKQGYRYWKNFALTSGKEDFNVGFYPEGGYLLSGVLNKVAFKAQDISGADAAIRMELMDATGQVILRDSTVCRGMGAFEFTPHSGLKYRVKCVNKQGLVRIFDLPDVQSETCGLRIENRRDSLHVSVNKALNALHSPLYLIAHVRGVPVYAGKWGTNRTSLSFNKTIFPPGVIQFLLLDQDYRIVSERLCFSKNYTPIDCRWTTDKTIYAAHEKITAEIAVSDSTGAPLQASLSVAVTDSAMQLADTNFNILSELLLTTELKGYIDNPSFYLNPDAEQALDLLLLTQGWRKYDLPAVLKGQLSHPTDIPESGFRIAGQLKSGGLFNRGTKGKVTIYNKTMAYTKEISTDEDGYFSIDDIEFVDGTGLDIIGQEDSKTKRSARRLPVEIAEELYPKASIHIPQYCLDEMLFGKEEDIGEAFWSNSDYQLAPVEVRATYLGSRDYIHLDEREIATKQYKSLYDLLISLGVEVITKENGLTQLRYKGKRIMVMFVDYRAYVDMNAFLSNASVGDIQELTLVADADGRLLDELFDVDMVNRNKIDTEEKQSYIDIVTKDSYDLRQLRSLNPVTLMAGSTSVDKHKSLMTTIYPLGYQQPVEFYVPLYEKQAEEHEDKSDVRPTVYWKPDIQTDGNGKASYSFYSSNKPATYTVVIEGITEKGDIIFETKKIKIGQNTRSE